MRFTSSQAADVVPGGAADLDGDLARGGRLDAHQGVAEVVHRHGQREQLLGGDAAAGEVGAWEGAAQGGHRRLAAERGQVGADEARRDAR